jgi:tellurite resistance-related uncharacterized protein
MPPTNALPTGVSLTRTTPVFDQDSVPAGLMAAHRIAAGVWGRLIVHAGTLRFVFEDATDRPHEIGTGGALVIPPDRPHHIEIDGPVRFAVEFYR